MKYNSKEIHKYVQKHQQQLSSLKAYFSKYEQNSIISNKIIIQMNEEIRKNLKSITQDKQTVRTIKQFAENSEERESSQKIVDFLKFKVNGWIQVCEGILGDLKDKMRNVDIKFQKKQLSEKDIAEFKVNLIEAISSFQENKEAILSHFSILQISCNAHLLESLTNRTQRLVNR